MCLVPTSVPCAEVEPTPGVTELYMEQVGAPHKYTWIKLADENTTSSETEP